MLSGGVRVAPVGAGADAPAGVGDAVVHALLLQAVVAIYRLAGLPFGGHQKGPREQEEDGGGHGGGHGDPQVVPLPAHPCGMAVLRGLLGVPGGQLVVVLDDVATNRKLGARAPPAAARSIEH